MVCQLIWVISDLMVKSYVQNSPLQSEHHVKTHSINEFNVGDYVGIDHKRVEPNASFKIIKINRVRILVEGRNGERFNVQSQLLIKKSIVGTEL